MGIKTLISILSLLGLSALFSYVMAWLILFSPVIRFFTDPPGTRKIHQKITPRIGGIGIVISFLMFLLIWHFTTVINHPKLPPQLLDAIIFGTLGIIIIGMTDDIIVFSISNRTKFLVEILIAVLLIAVSGIKFDTIYFAEKTYSLGFATWPVTVLWLVGVTNALNIIDGVDGLAGTISLVSFCTVGIFAFMAGDQGIVILCTLCAGLIVGFLAHNIPPARIFLGDTGSLFFGMILGLLCVYLVSTISRPYPVIIAPLILGFPLLDVALAMLRRFLKGLIERKSLFRSILKTMEPDNDHIHHRLMFRGLRHSQTTIVIATYSITTCAVAVVIGIVQGVSTLIFMIYLGLITGWFTYKLGFFDRYLRIIPGRYNQKPNKYLNQRKRINIIVLNADEYLKHALEFYQQKVFALRFMEKGEKINDSIKFAEISAVLVNSNHVEQQVDELNQAINLSTRFQCPLIFMADSCNADGLERAKKLGIKTLLVRKPIYVPKLFNDIYLIAGKNDTFSNYNGMICSEKPVSPLVDGK